MCSSGTGCLRIFHGGSFERVPHLLYIESEVSMVYLDPDYLSVEDLKENVVKLGYSEDRIKEIYLSRPNVPFEESLVPIQTDKEVREVIRLCSELEFVSIYVEHNDDVNDKGKKVLSNEGGDENSDSSVGEEEYFPDVNQESDAYDDDDWSNSDNDDPELKEIRDKKGAAKEAINAELEELEANVVDEGMQSNDGGAEHYQDSDNADSPADDSGADDDDHTAGKKRKRKMREKYPRYSGPSVANAELYVGMKFRDKKQLKEAVENYRIVKVYHLKITKSDTVKFQCQCLGKGCKWSLWAFKCKNESSFQFSKQ